MMKKIYFLAVLVALGFVAMAQKQNGLQGPSNADHIEKTPASELVLPMHSGVKAQWDIAYSFNTPYLGFLGVETDGNKIYSSQFDSEYFYEFEMDGSNPEWFVIPGVQHVRDMAYASSTGYVYGTDASMNIFVMDMPNRQLVKTIAVNCTGITGVRHIAFDPTLDGGKGGFWIGQWNEIGAVNMEGNELISNTATPFLASCSGSAYDGWSTPGSPKLWFYVTPLPAANQPQLIEFDINSLSFTGVSHSTSDVPGYQLGDISGACATYSADGKHYILANLQCQALPRTNTIVAYELETYTVPVSNWAILLSVLAVVALIFVGVVIKK